MLSTGSLFTGHKILLKQLRPVPCLIRQCISVKHMPCSGSSHQQLRASPGHQLQGLCNDATEELKPAQCQQQQHRLWSDSSSIYYSNYPLDRVAEQRKNEAQLSEWFNGTSARVTPVMGSKVFLLAGTHDSNSADCSSSSSSSTSTSSTRSSCSASPKYIPVWLSPATELGAAAVPTVPPLFLGLDTNGNPHFAVQVTADAGQALTAEHGASWVSARTAGPDMSRQDAALMAVASGLAQWNLESQHHGATGEATLAQDGGFSRRCTSSGRTVYPRIDPAIITLVTCGPDWCLLGRKPDWPQGRYSTLAGFLELGETLEQALCREVLEEAGVVTDLHSVRYVASQPWPFPKSLMVGFYADAAVTGMSTAGRAADAAAGAGSTNGAACLTAVEGLSHEGRMAMMDTGLRPAEVAEAVQGLRLQQPHPQEDEMQDVRWFHREWLSAALQQGQAAAPSGFFIPGEYSLAYKLITGWLSSSSSSKDSMQAVTAANGDGNGSGSSAWSGDEVPQVDIDQGTFKYVLLRLADVRDSSQSKLLVRGSSAAAYHNHILQHTKNHLPTGLDVQVLGGGRIEHCPQQQSLRVYGYSAAFGPAVHEVTAGLLKKWYPFYDVITWSYDGY